MDNIKVSVIVPVYNVELYLNTCLDSICAQTYKNFEVKSSLQSEGSRSFFVLLFKS